MKYHFDLGDREATVTIEPHGGGYRVVVDDGPPRLVDARRVSADTWSLIVRGEGEPTVSSTEAAVMPGPANGSLDVYVGGVHVPMTPRGGAGRRARGSAGMSGAGPQRVLAPMPGKVVRVLVKAGDAVGPRQGLVVVEAMKMENELRAGRAGHVREVFVREGQSVEAGTALVIVE
jgi:biotin carboxyl carrier protein